MSDTIIFFKAGSFSHVNQNLREILEREFPNFRLRVVDVMTDILKHQPLAVVRALIEVAWLYPREVFLRRRKPTDFLLRTPAAFRAIKEWVGKNIRPSDATFTIQTQSLFNAVCEGIPHFIYTDHTGLANRRYLTPVSPEFLNPRWISLEKSTFESARLTFTTSNFARTSLIEDYGIDPVRAVCVFSGTNIRCDPLPPRDEFKKIVLFVGVDWVRKGGPELMEAFQEVLKVHPDAKLHIVGCAPRTPHPSIEVFGQLSLDAMAERFREADLFCLPSYFEPSAVVYAEAMHYGLPSIGTRSGGTPDRILDGETGFIIEPGDVKGLAQALIRMLDNPVLCRKMGEAAQRLGRAHFTWGATGKVLCAHIRSILGQDVSPSEDTSKTSP